MFWKATTYNEPYWDGYLAARPTYSSDFYDRVIEYYRTHNPSPPAPNIAHDVGTGPGQVAAELCKYFDTIIASDANSTHLAVASTRNEKIGLNSQISWTKVSAEDLHSCYPASSATFLAAAECLPLLDVPRALNTFSHLLQPNGTLAAWFYGRPAFADPALAAKGQPILNDIIDLTFEKVIKGRPSAHKATWKRSTDTVYSFLDNVAFPADTWRDVYRHKWNPHLPLSVIGPNACDYPIEPSSCIDKSREKIIEEQDLHFWEEMWDISEVRRFVECLLPNIEELKGQGVYDHVEVKYTELEEAMGGPDIKWGFTWPVVLILATRV
jgi:ubiquinone/menaquinone biosynthesis C-methylase UbiE